MQTKVIVKVLGTAQDGGVPHPNCSCEHCQLSDHRPELRRLASSLAIILPDLKKWHLVDATPDMREQLTFLKRSHPELGLMDSVLLTHAHIGHYTGLMFLGKEVISTKHLPVYAGQEMQDFLASHAPWKQLVDLQNINLESIWPDEVLVLDNAVKVTPLQVPHRNEYAKTFGFVISGKVKKLLYIPDIDRWEQWDRDLQEISSSVDYCLVDGTFFSEQELTDAGRDYKHIPHPLMSTTMDLLANLVQNSKTKVYFTHFNHTNPAVNPDSDVTAMIRSKGFEIAEEGMEFQLS
ncbi:MBL fold metallo-hydrolase [Pseudalkalibacillus decolorationis]|uniref:MBL fold metallo-hydrolase n=1 Tax=Pseudalkalibacillus decolorationis TaxID=163879 RepID=UPI002147D4C6|nr:MBL fold metallo-hydrolase [Pseudalkalibacillus decolorationis]